MWRLFASSRVLDIERGNASFNGTQYRQDPSFWNAAQGPIVIPEEYVRAGVLGIFVVLLIVGIVPLAFAFWFCVGLILVVCTKAPIQMRLLRSRHRRPTRLQENNAPWMQIAQDSLHLTTTGSMFDVHHSLNRREYNSQDSEAMISDPQGNQGTADSEIASLPTYEYVAPKPRQPLPGTAEIVDAQRNELPSGSGSDHDMDQVATESATRHAVLLGEKGSSELPPAALQDDGHLASGSRSRRDAGQFENPVCCVVCLDTFHEGDQVMALPCMHQFHQKCIMPWLRQKGMRAVCPVCKTPCFG